MLKRKTQSHCQLTVQIIKSNTLIVHNYSAYILKNISDKFLVVLIDLSPHFIDCFCSVVC